MSSNLIQDNDITIEEDSYFTQKSNRNIPGYINGDTLNRNTSFSVLNSGKKNIHNSIFTDLVTSPNGFITKKNYGFKENVSKIDPYYVKKNTKNSNQCMTQCKEKSYCSAYSYDQKNRKCELYNGIPDKFVEGNSKISGYKNSYKFNFDKLKDDQKEHINKRIGSQYLMNRFNISEKNEPFENNNQPYTIEGYENNNINTCIMLKKESIKVPMKIIFKTSNKNYSGSKKMTEVYLTYKGESVSNNVSLLNTTIKKGTNTSVNIDFYLTDTLFDGINMTVDSDGLRLTGVEIYIRLKKKDLLFFSKNFDGYIWMKGNSTIINFGKTINLDDMEVSSDIITQIGSNTKNEALLISDAINMNNILSKDNWSANFNLNIKKLVGEERIIFHHGSNKNEVEPTLQIRNKNNDQWGIRLRIQTNKTDRNLDFRLPEKYRELDKTMNFNLNYSKLDKGFLITLTIEGILLKSYYLNETFSPKKNLPFYIKSPWNKTNDYDVNDLKFTSRIEKKLTTHLTYKDNSAKQLFITSLNNINTPYYIIRKAYTNFNEEYFYIVYKRLTSSNGVNMYSLFHENWTDINNKFNTDFELYSSLESAINSENRWSYCDFNTGTGFPGKCGITKDSSKSNQYIPGNNQSWELWLYKNETRNISNLMESNSKISGFRANPKCIYDKLGSTGDIYNRNLESIDDEFNNNKIESSINEYDNLISDIYSLNKDNNALRENPKLHLKMANEANNITSMGNKKSYNNANTNTTEIKKKIGGNIIEKFDNMHRNNLLCYFVILIILFFILYFITQ